MGHMLFCIYDSNMPRLLDRWLISLVRKMISTSSCVSSVHCYLIIPYYLLFMPLFYNFSLTLWFPLKIIIFGLKIKCTLFVYLFFSSMHLSMQAHISNLSLKLSFSFTPPLRSSRHNFNALMYLRVRACVFQPIFTSHSFDWRKSYCKYFLNSMALQYILTFMVFRWASFYLLERVCQTEFLVDYFTKFSWYCCEKCWSPQGCHGTS